MNLFHHLPTGLSFDLDPSIGIVDTLRSQGWDAGDVVILPDSHPVAVLVRKIWECDKNTFCLLTDHFFTRDEAEETWSQLNRGVQPSVADEVWTVLDRYTPAPRPCERAKEAAKKVCDSGLFCHCYTPTVDEVAVIIHDAMVSQNTAYPIGVAVDAHAFKVVAEVQPAGGNEKLSRARADVAAAAPQMLRALQELHKLSGEDGLPLPDSGRAVTAFAELQNCIFKVTGSALRKAGAR